MQTEKISFSRKLGCIFLIALVITGIALIAIYSKKNRNKGKSMTIHTLEQCLSIHNQYSFFTDSLNFNDDFVVEYENSSPLTEKQINKLNKIH